MDDDRRTALFEEMWERRQRTWAAIARAERRHERDAILRMLGDRKGVKDDESTD